MLEVKNLHKKYGNGNNTVEALQNINLCFEYGEFVAIVGKSGCGKSTLLNIISGLLSASEGEVIYEGQNVLNLSKKKMCEYRMKNIGIVLQNFALLNDRTVYQNIELPLKIRKIPKSVRREIIKEYLEKLGITDKADKFPSELSGGQKQRVAIARALICNPNVLIADEPTGSLDEDNATQIVELLKNISESGKIVIMTTHNKELISYCDRCVTLSEGKVV